MPLLFFISSLNHMDYGDSLTDSSNPHFGLEYFLIFPTWGWRQCEGIHSAGLCPGSIKVLSLIELSDPTDKSPSLHCFWCASLLRYPFSSVSSNTPKFCRRQFRVIMDILGNLHTSRTVSSKTSSLLSLTFLSHFSHIPSFQLP